MRGDRAINRILSTRSRLRFKQREWELSSRLGTIRRSYKELDPAIHELLRYYPIALVACVESWFRLVICELIDSGEPYLGNARDLLEKVDFDILEGLHGQTVTIGEVISYHPSISSLPHVIAIIDTVMGGGFRKRVSEVHDRWKVEIEKQPTVPIIADIDETLRHVDRTFELRHIFCHEIATAIELEHDEIEKCIDHTATFLKATNELISQTLFPDAPLTQMDMNIASSEDYKKEREGLEALIEMISAILSGKQADLFVKANEAWEDFRKASVAIESLEYEGGSIRPTISALAAAQLVRDRKVQLERLLDFLKVEG